jgi:hypothetical protein
MNTSTANNNKLETLFHNKTEQTEKTEGFPAAFAAHDRQKHALRELFLAPPQPFSALSEILGVKQ